MPMTQFLFILASLWGCNSLDEAETLALQPALDAEFQAYLGPTFYQACPKVQTWFWIEPEGELTWISEDPDGSWERVTGTWTREPEAILSHTLEVDGVKTAHRVGASHPTAAPWSGTLHLTSMAAIPAIAFKEEARTWDHGCVDSTADLAAVWARGQEAGTITITGSLYGVFEPE